MCELFGASASSDRSFSRWLKQFRLRGGKNADNPDGWGVAYWNAGQPCIEKTPEPGWQSPRFLELAEQLHCRLVLAHVRRATNPPTTGLQNTHPFAHACCDREWVFAHNGMVPAIANWACPSSVCHPQGETDSETAFCHLLAGIAGEYGTADQQRWLARLVEVAKAIAATGKFNFLMSDGRLLIAYGHDRLHYLDRGDGQQAHALVSTEPLTGDDWQCFAPGELRVYCDGKLSANHIPPQLPSPAVPVAA